MRIIGGKKEKNYIMKIFGQMTLDHEIELKEHFEKLLEEEREIISGMRLQINLSDVYYMDSVIIGVFVGLKKRLETSGIELDFLNTPEIVLKVFRMLSLDKFFNFYECPEWREENE